MFVCCIECTSAASAYLHPECHRYRHPDPPHQGCRRCRHLTYIRNTIAIVIRILRIRDAVVVVILPTSGMPSFSSSYLHPECHRCRHPDPPRQGCHHCRHLTYIRNAIVIRIPASGMLSLSSSYLHPECHRCRHPDPPRQGCHHCRHLTYIRNAIVVVIQILRVRDAIIVVSLPTSGMPSLSSSGSYASGMPSLLSSYLHPECHRCHHPDPPRQGCRHCHHLTYILNAIVVVIWILRVRDAVIVVILPTSGMPSLSSSGSSASGMPSLSSSYLHPECHRCRLLDPPRQGCRHFHHLTYIRNAIVVVIWILRVRDAVIVVILPTSGMPSLSSSGSSVSGMPSLSSSYLHPECHRCRHPDPPRQGCHHCCHLTYIRNAIVVVIRILRVRDAIIVVIQILLVFDPVPVRIPGLPRVIIKGTVRPDWICMSVVSLESP